MIKAIITDLDGVLFTNGTKEFIDVLCKKYNIERNLIIEFIDGDLGSRYREAKINRDDFWKIFLKRFQLSENKNSLEKNGLVDIFS